MGSQKKNHTIKHICAGLLAHVDAGKTTLSEAMLYKAGAIRKQGRVDNQDAFLDTDSIERERGITVFSKEARFCYQDKLQVELLDTPGHVDFSAEMERVLQVLDYAVLIVSASDGIQEHTHTLWRLLSHYQVPVFLFVNKMDQPDTSRKKLMEELQHQFGSGCVDMNDSNQDGVMEQIAMTDEETLNEYLEHGLVNRQEVRRLILERKLFPCYFGSALRMEGVQEFLEALACYTETKSYPETFSARVFKITRDEQGNRLSWLKVTGGRLKVKSCIQDEKINQIRIYSGTSFELANEVEAGHICAVTGPLLTFAGQGIGEDEKSQPVLEPVLTYQVILPDGMDAMQMLLKLRQLEEEDPLLRVNWQEKTREILVQVMGKVQLEVLKRLIKDRFQTEIEFGNGSILYKETITKPVEGVGHFEPLKHYAEVHLRLEPAERGSGIEIESDCREEVLDKNWQRLILTHMREKEHLGVLCGVPITDVKMTLVSGRAHQKHTEGGDFREATYRAIRQGLRMTESKLLEPYYEFHMELPQEQVGRAMTDIERMNGTFTLGEVRDGLSVLTGMAPVVTMQEYKQDFLIYTKGKGNLAMNVAGYFPCHNEEEVKQAFAYDPDRDLSNPSGSVFCSHGAGFVVNWDEVPEYMHLPYQKSDENEESDRELSAMQGQQYEEPFIDTDEIDAILQRTFYANQKNGFTPHKGIGRLTRKKKPEEFGVMRTYKKMVKKDPCLLVDGYNVIFAWKDLAELAKINMDSARGSLMDTLCEYQAIIHSEVIVVFDAYRVKDHGIEWTDYQNIHVVYTKEAQTADAYIERFTNEHADKFDITVATSDGLEQIITIGQGCHLLSSRELQKEIEYKKERFREQYLNHKNDD